VFPFHQGTSADLEKLKQL